MEGFFFRRGLVRFIIMRPSGNWCIVQSLNDNVVWTLKIVFSYFLVIFHPSLIILHTPRHYSFYLPWLYPSFSNFCDFFIPNFPNIQNWKHVFIWSTPNTPFSAAENPFLSDECCGIIGTGLLLQYRHRQWHFRHKSEENLVIKRKVRPRTDHKGPKGGRGTALLFL